MKFLTVLHTDIGIKKKTNQDSALILEAKTSKGNALLTVICDGMGGLSKGEVASSTVISSFASWFENDFVSLLSLDDPQTRIFSDWEKIIFSCNDRIKKYAKEHSVSMGTTLAATLFYGNRYYGINVGDTRIYYIADNLVQLTKDHTFVQREIDMGRMTVEEAKVSPQRNVLLQCIGASEYIVPDFISGEIASGVMFLLCSDGFRHLITNEEIYERLNPYVLSNEQSMLDNIVYLTELNKYRRENDNITALLVRVD